MSSEVPAMTGKVNLYGCRLIREGGIGYGRARQVVRRAEDAAAVIWEMAGERDREAFCVLWLTTRHTVIGGEVATIGTADACPVSPREVFRGAIGAGAVAVIVGHNHPSGDPEPSEDDRRISARLREAGRVVGIEVLDHVIVGTGAEGRRFVSLRERGGWAE